jgi:hypothetical protein
MTKSLNITILKSLNLMSVKMNILANDLFGFMKAEDWEALLAFINENVDEHPYLIDGSLNLALIANIPEFVIKELIQYGGKISPMSLLPLILQEILA